MNTAVNYEELKVQETKQRLEKFVQRDSAGFGDDKNALERFADLAGVSFWTLDRIKQGKAKTVTGGVIERVKVAYLDYCESQLTKLKHEIAIEKAIQDDADIRDLEIAAEKLAAELQEKRKAQWEQRLRTLNKR